MASITSFVGLRHLRAEPNQHILHFSGGKLIRQGPGLAYWFMPLSASVAQVPVEDCETTFVLKERSSDFQEVTVQVTISYRFTDPVKAAGRVNFTIGAKGTWLEQPLERLASLWSQRAQNPARAYLSGVSVVDAVRAGGAAILSALSSALGADQEIAGMGVAVVNVQVTKVSSTAELEKALQAPTRELIQQKADEAGFARRANAVEKERAIKENELSTELELAKRHELLIEQQGRNNLLTVEREAQAAKQATAAEAERTLIQARAYADQVLVRAEGDAKANRVIAEQAQAAEGERVALWRDAPPRVALGFAAQDFAGKLQSIQHLNITPDLLRDLFHQSLRDQDESGDRQA